MKKDHESTAVEIEGFGKTVTYGIKGDGLGHIFNILRNQLYTNKIAAVIREYSCNAVDANTENGKANVPIEVTLPNWRNLCFSVRDFGKGLSQEQIENIFCYYGESTKSNSNAYIGQLGIGSKSAFCYAQSYTIKSYLDGKLTTYLSYIDDSQLGVISVVSEEDTDEENGLQIDIPVQAKDIGEFDTTAQSIYFHFSVRPKIKNPDINIYELIDADKRDKTFLSTPEFTIYSDAYTIRSLCSQSRVIARMGNIAYPISMNEECVKIFADKYINDRTTLIIEFNIGDLSISANREGLEMNNKTRTCITNRVNAVKTELGKLLADKLEKAIDVIDACAVTTSISSILRSGREKANYTFKKNNSVYNLGTYLTQGYYHDGMLFPIEFNRTPIDRDYALYTINSHGYHEKIERFSDKDLSLRRVVSSKYHTTLELRTVQNRLEIDFDVNADSDGAYPPRYRRTISGFLRGAFSDYNKDKGVFALILIKTGPKADEHLLRDGIDDDSFKPLSSFTPINHAGDPGVITAKVTRNTSKILTDSEIHRTDLTIVNKWLKTNVLNRKQSDEYLEQSVRPENTKTINLKTDFGYFSRLPKYRYRHDDLVTESCLIFKLCIDAKIINQDAFLHLIPVSLYNRYKTSIHKYLKTEEDLMVAYLDLLNDTQFRAELDCFLATQSTRSSPIVDLIRAYPKVFANDTEITSEVANIKANAQAFITRVVGSHHTTSVDINSIAHVVKEQLETVKRMLSRIDLTKDPRLPILKMYLDDITLGNYHFIESISTKFKNKYLPIDALVRNRAISKREGSVSFEWATSYPDTIESVLKTIVDSCMVSQPKSACNNQSI